MIKMKNRNTGYSSDSEQNKQDLSVLRKPISTALTGFLESKRAYDNGTEEIRRLLARECDVLYECKVCRNMFRSLTNFISHKRVYCRTAFTNLSNHFNSNNGFIDQDISTIIQAEQDYVNNSTTKDNKSNENSNKDLSSIIERLLKREQANRILKLTDFYDQVNNKLTQDEVLRKKHELQLDRVPNSNVAVYQTVKKDGNDNIKKEVTEVNDLVFNQKNILGTDGKIISDDNNIDEVAKEPGPCKIKSEEDQKKVIINKSISCEICKLKFSTEKTLTLHLQTKHISSTFVYQCPSCSQTFLQPRAVFRHLSNDHKKSMRRIRLMRESILKRRVRMDEIQTKGPSRELARLQTDSEKRDAENKAWMNNIELSNNAPMCAYCGKTFERKAVLTTHLNSCSLKNNRIASQSKKLTEIASTSSSRTEDTNSTANDLEELKDIKDIDLSTLNEYLSRNEPDPNVPLGSKRKRKRTSKVLQQTEPTDTESLNDHFWNLDTTENLSLKTVTLDEPPIKVEPEELTEPSDSPVKSSPELTFYCRICVKKFDVLSNLRRHISMFHYRKRKFGCKLCDYRAFRKYDVINHLNSNHSITGEREVVLQYVVVKELNGERNDENIDGDVIIAEDGKLDPELSTKHLEKRRRRTKVKVTKPLMSSPPEASSSAETKPESKFTRSSSNLSLSSNEELSSLSKRPVRNRVKPVNKDFVYDLSNLLKKDMVLSERDSSVALVPARTQRRRATQSLLDENSRDSITPPVISNGDAPATEAAEGASNTLIHPPLKGSALLMAKLAVSTFTACFYKPPDLPLERPSILGRLTPSLKSEAKPTDWPSIKSDFQSQAMRRISDDSLIHVLSKKRRQEINSKLLSSSVETPAPKLELSINGDSKVNLPPPRSRDGSIDGEKIMVKLFSTEKEFKECLIANKLADASVTTKSTFPEIKPNVPVQPAKSSSPNTKRITLMERLAENKKLRDSLLKSALEN